MWQNGIKLIIKLISISMLYRKVCTIETHPFAFIYSRKIFEEL